MQRLVTLSCVLLVWVWMPLSAQTLDNLTYTDSDGTEVENCLPSGLFSFDTKGFHHKPSILYDVIIETEFLSTAKKLTSIRPIQVNGNRVIFACPSVNEITKAFVRPSNRITSGYSAEVVFATGLIPQITNLEYGSGVLSFDTNLAGQSATLHLNVNRKMALNINRTGQVRIRLPSNYKEGSIVLANKHGKSQPHRVATTFSVTLSIRSLPQDDYFVFDLESGLLLPLTFRYKPILDHGSMNKVSLYTISDNELPIVKASAYYLSGKELKITPESSAAVAVFDAIDTSVLSLQDKKSLYRYITQSDYIKPLTKRYASLRPTRETPLFKDEKSQEIIGVIASRMNSHIKLGL